MRKKLAGALSVALATITVPSASAATSVPYSWRNVRLDAGGFVSGIVFNPTEQNLIYARTDIGGAYRWNQSTSTWTPLLDWIGWDRWGWNGVLSTGAVWKYQISTGTWTNITPPTPGGGNPWYGFAGLSIDKRAANTVMVTGYSSWWPDTFIFRSTDAGATWRSFWDFAYPNRTNHYNLDISSVPWLTYADQKSLPEQVPKLGWMTEALEIDPFNSNRMMYGGASIYGTTNLTALDTGGTVNLAPMVRGMESSVVTDLVSHPSGALFSGMLDIGGFRHTNLDAVPALMYTPFMSAVTSLDYAEGSPMWMVRVGQTDRTNSANIAYSTDAGANWFSGSVPNGAQRGYVAMNANASRVVWSSENAGLGQDVFGGLELCGLDDWVVCAGDRDVVKVLAVC